MKLINFNIGIKIDNSKNVAEFILEQKPDIVTFQEIVRHFDESTFEMYKSEYVIKKIIGSIMPYSFFGPLFLASKFTKNGKIYRDLGGMIEQGNEIFSRFEIISASNEHYYNNYRLDEDRTNFQTEDHSRAVQIVEIDIKGKKLQVITIHGAYSEDKKDSERSLKQCEYVLNVAKRKNLPTIITGDFNLIPETESIKILEKEFRNLSTEHKLETTIPSFFDGKERGKKVIDYIFVNDRIKVNDFKALETDISDHYPLVLDFDIQ